MPILPDAGVQNDENIQAIKIPKAIWSGFSVDVLRITILGFLVVVVLRQKKMHIILRDVLKWHGCGGPSVAV